MLVWFHKIQTTQKIISFITFSFTTITISPNSRLGSIRWCEMLQEAEKEAVRFLFSWMSVYFPFFVGYLFLKMLLVIDSVPSFQLFSKQSNLYFINIFHRYSSVVTEMIRHSRALLCNKQENISSALPTAFWLPVPQTCFSEEWDLCVLV